MKFIKSFFIVIIFLTLVYLSGWLYLAHKTNKEIDMAFEEAQTNETIEFYGEKPKVSGFPAKPSLTYKKGLKYGDMDITFDDFTVTASPLPGQDLDFKFDNLFMRNTLSEQNLEINELSGTIKIPKSIPETMTKEHLVPWQKDVGQIYFKDIYINKNSMIARAEGPIGLDENLQPTMLLKSKITDYDKLITFMAKEASELSPIAAGVARVVLDGMAKTDETTGQKYVEFDILIKDRKLSLGPIKAIKLPKIEWEESLTQQNP